MQQYQLDFNSHQSGLKRCNLLGRGGGVGVGQHILRQQLLASFNVTEDLEEQKIYRYDPEIAQEK